MSLFTVCVSVYSLFTVFLYFLIAFQSQIFYFLHLLSWYLEEEILVWFTTAAALWTWHDWGNLDCCGHFLIYIFRPYMVKVSCLVAMKFAGNILDQLHVWRVMTEILERALHHLFFFFSFFPPFFCYCSVTVIYINISNIQHSLSSPVVQKEEARK